MLTDYRDLVGTPLEDALRAIAEAPDSAPQPSREERLKAAREAVEEMPFAEGLRSTARRLVLDGRNSSAKYAAIFSDPDLRDDGKRRRAAELAKEYEGDLAKELMTVAAYFATAEGLVLKTDPTYAPADAADGTRINGILADADAFDPATMDAVARQAIARRDFPLIARLLPKLQGFVQWKRPYTDSSVIVNLIEDLGTALTTDDVIRSDAVRDWLNEARADVRNLVKELREGHGQPEAMNPDRGDLRPIVVATGGLSTLFPDKVIE